MTLPGMNRSSRRALKRNLRHKAPDSVTLQGGPMDGWVVTPTAPALEPTWYSTLPAHLLARWRPGRYRPVEGSSPRVARWHEGADR